MTHHRVIFMGTPAFALPALESLLASPHEICAVYTQPPRPAGRGQKLTPSPVHTLAEARGIPVHTPTTLKALETQAQLKAYGADVALVAAYGLLLPKPVLDAPRYGCINIHPSALPRWRGAAPLQRTLMAGDATSACCIMQMEAGLDTGPVLLREELAIPAAWNAGNLHDHMATLGARLAMQVLASLPLKGEAQSEHGVTYANKISKEDQGIDWSHSAKEICNQVRGLSPSMGATFRVGNEIIKLFEAKAEYANGTEGTVLDDGGLVACGNGTALRLMQLQRAGKQRQAANEFFKAFPLTAGTVLA